MICNIAVWAKLISLDRSSISRHLAVSSGLSTRCNEQSMSRRGAVTAIDESYGNCYHVIVVPSPPACPLASAGWREGDAACGC